MGKLRDILQKYISANQMFDTIEYFKNNNIDYLYPIKNYSFLLNINNSKNLYGGDEYLLDLKLKYQVNVDEYYDVIYEQSNKDTNKSNKDKNKNIKIINFIKLNAIKDERCDYGENDSCGILIIDYIKKSSVIQSLNNYTDCVKCLEKDKIVSRCPENL